MNVAVVTEPDAGWVNIKINDLPALAVGIVNVHDIPDVNVAVNTVPLANESVLDAPTVPIACNVSV